MEKDQQPGPEPTPMRPIRVETALSRFPVHRLARKGTINIDIREQDADGEVATRWEVDYSKKHGQPGPLAYKIDTLIVNRRIEEAARPIPKLIHLGSLRDICRELGMTEGKNVNAIRRALRQNAFAGITARTTYKHSDGTEQTLEADFTRYSVIFTGEALPDGRRADGVYLLLNEIFMRVVDGAVTRPLDYDYLRGLAPGPQRLYELLSYRMYAALKYGRPHARLAYSELCAHAPQARHLSWEAARCQLGKLHRPHVQSGYIAGFDHEQTADGDGRPDWWLLYRPGPRARAEFEAFARKGAGGWAAGSPEAVPPAAPLAASLAAPRAAPPSSPASPPAVPLAASQAAPGGTELERELVGRGIAAATASALVREHGEARVRSQIEHLDWLAGSRPEQVEDPAAYLVGAIRGDYGPPRGFLAEARRRRREEAGRAEGGRAAERSRLERAEAALEREKRRRDAAYWESLTPGEQAELDAEALAQADPESRAMEARGGRTLERLIRQVRRGDYIRQLLDGRGPGPSAP